ncbi:ABC transporter ATP-binding protein [Synechococcus sp. NOUM97013]|uniref:ABC transporter ATP-binding protein n=1 Tax=Synechococcus sp. NOUM97013 TaxID=1442555 RepID=UPI001648D68C|nr:ABC transporter ATP-binding protein [Synechococcus sp. NOUM97013]
MVASGLAEVGSLAAAVPFLAVLSDPEQLWQQPVVRSLSIGLGLESAQALLLPITLGFGIAAILAAAIRLVNVWINGRLAAAIGSDLSCEAYKRTLYQPYEVHMKRNSSEVITSITTQIGQTVRSIKSTLQLATSALVALAILVALLAVDWSVACTAISVFGLAYGLLSFKIRRRLVANNHLVVTASAEQLKALQEGLGAIRDVLLDGSQSTFLDIYQRADRPMRLRIAQNTFLGVFPRYAFEALGLLLIALLALLLSWKQKNSISLIPLLGTLALGSQRLLPALQQIYGNWVVIRSLRVSVEQVLKILSQPIPSHAFRATSQPLQLNHSIKCEDLCFRYSHHLPYVLKNMNLEIYRGERVGLIGSTGSGKSTLVDLLMGLLNPTSGKILIDGLDLNDSKEPSRLVAWRAAIAHVPQSIFLADSSIAENIAFGIPTESIDLAKVRHAAAQAQIASFIESTSDGYDTYVGERGVRLSGGQRQRIGIARALYKKASIILFDEATSALDSSTEEEVMAALEGLSKEITVIMIAHRLSTLACCDRVFELSTKSSIRATTPPDIL